MDRHNEHFVGRAAELRSAIGMTDEEDGAADAVERTLHRRSVDQIVSLVGVPGQSIYGQVLHCATREASSSIVVPQARELETPDRSLDSSLKSMASCDVNFPLFGVFFSTLFAV